VLQAIGEGIHLEGPILIRRIVANSTEFRDFMPEVEKYFYRQRRFFRMEAMIESHFRIKAGLPLVAPVRYLGENPAVPVIIEFPVAAREKEQEMFPVSFMENKHFCLRISFRDRFRPSECFDISSMPLAEGIVIKITTIAVDEAYYCVAWWQRTSLSGRNFRVGRRNGAARKQRERERYAERSPEQPQTHWCSARKRSVV
jgi:hypothetical protein